MTKIDKALEIAIEIANDNLHGYSQIRRNGPDYDCSSLVLHCLKTAGIDTGKATYTGNMRSELTKHGFIEIPYKKGMELLRGDILLNEKYHTLFYLGEKKIVQASISETGGITGKTGDQTGREIYIGNFYEYSKGWDYILRYTGEDTKQEDKKVNIVLTVLKQGSKGNEVKTLQVLLYSLGFNCGTADGDFGPKTDAALRNYQKAKGLKVDGICGKCSWTSILTGA